MATFKTRSLHTANKKLWSCKSNHYYVLIFFLIFTNRRLSNCKILQALVQKLQKLVHWVLCETVAAIYIIITSNSNVKWTPEKKLWRTIYPNVSQFIIKFHLFTVRFKRLIKVKKNFSPFTLKMKENINQNEKYETFKY